MIYSVVSESVQIGTLVIGICKRLRSLGRMGPNWRPPLSLSVPNWRDSLPCVLTLIVGGLKVLIKILGPKLTWFSPRCTPIVRRFKRVPKMRLPHDASRKAVRPLHTEKSFRNLIKSNRNQIRITMHRLIWNSKRTESVCCSKLTGAW